MGLNTEELRVKHENIKQKRAISIYRAYFRGRGDVIAEQLDNGKYRPIQLALSEDVITAHISGQSTYGIYLLNPGDNKSAFLVIDLDVKDLTLVKQITTTAAGMGIDSQRFIVEDTGGDGYHIWYLFESFIPAYKARMLGKIIVSLSGIDMSIEIFPKQDFVPENGFGNLIKLPLGVHKKTGGKAFFLDSSLSQSQRFWLDDLESVTRLSEEEIDKILENNKDVLPIKAEETAILDSSEREMERDLLPCYERILVEGVDEGNRDNATYRLTVYFKNNGMSEDEILDILAKWNKRNRPSLPLKELEGIIHSTFLKEYKGLGCEDPFMKLLCSGGCPVYKKCFAEITLREPIDESSCDEPTQDHRLLTPIPEKIIPAGFIRDYIDFAEPLSEAPMEFHIGSAFPLVSTVCGRNIYMPWGPKMLFANLFVLLVGASGITRKSTAISLPYDIVMNLGSDYLVGDMTSVEGLYDSLKKFPNKIAVYNEFKSLMDNCGKNYGEGLRTALINLWDCRPMVKMNFKSIKNEEDKVVALPTISLLAATNMSMLALKPQDMENGFLGRFLPIYSMGRNKALPIPPKREEERFIYLVNRLKAIGEINGEFKFSPAANRLYCEIYHYLYAQGSSLRDKAVLEPFWTRISDHIVKLAMILKVSSCQPNLVIEEQDVAIAWKIMQYIIEYYQFLISRIEFNPMTRWENKFVDMLEVAKKKGVSKSELLKSLHGVDAKQLGNLINTASIRHPIVFRPISTATKPTHMYFLAKYAPKIIL